MSEKYIYTPEIEAPDLRSKREKVDDLKKALQESRRIVVNQNFSLSTALAILPEWVRDIIETGITVYDFIDSRLIVDGQWIKIRFINFRWNWKILTGLISSIIRIYKTWTDKPTDVIIKELRTDHGDLVLTEVYEGDKVTIIHPDTVLHTTKDRLRFVTDRIVSNEER